MSSKKNHKAVTIANAILSLSNPDVGDVISNLKLQKLLYYSQGFNLAINKEPLFIEDIKAWQYGPVVPEVYHKYKENKFLAIEPPKNFDYKKEGIPKKQYELLQEIYEVYGQFSAVKLMNMTHNEPPWQKTKITEVISHSLLKEYFSTLIKG